MLLTVFTHGNFVADFLQVKCYFKTFSHWHVYAWCGAKHLQLNADKTELLWFGPASQLCRLPSHSNSININQCVVKPVTVVRDLGVWFDAELSMRSHRTRVAQTCFLSSTPNTCRSTTARPRRYSKTSYSTCPVASGLLQRRAGRSSSFHLSTVPASPARSSTHRYGSQTA